MAAGKCAEGVLVDDAKAVQRVMDAAGKPQLAALRDEQPGRIHGLGESCRAQVVLMEGLAKVHVRGGAALA